MWLWVGSHVEPNASVARAAYSYSRRVTDGSTPSSDGIGPLARLAGGTSRSPELQVSEENLLSTAIRR